jgi:hypothetical protein
MTRRKRSPAATLWKAIKDSEVQDDVDEILAMSDAELDAHLAANGADPAKIRADGEALAKELDARHHRLAWQDEARAKLERFQTLAAAAAARTAGRPKLPRAELLARLERARTDARFTSPVTVAFRNRKPEASTDEELQTLLDEIDLLAELVKDDEEKK